MRNLDEEIRNCEEVADGFDELAQEIAEQDENGVYQPRVSWYQDRALSQRQLAERLRELKAYREAKKEIELKTDKCPYNEIRYGMRNALYIQEKYLKEVIMTNEEMTNEEMTNEKAINMLKSKMDGHTDTSYEWAETVRMAIKALEQQEQIEEHLRSAYDCGYNCGYSDALIDIAGNEKQ